MNEIFFHHSIFVFRLAFRTVAACCHYLSVALSHAVLFSHTHIIRLSDAFKEIEHKKKKILNFIVFCSTFYIQLDKHTRSKGGRALHKIQISDKRTARSFGTVKYVYKLALIVQHRLFVSCCFVFIFFTLRVVFSDGVSALSFYLFNIITKFVKCPKQFSKSFHREF